MRHSIRLLFAIADWFAWLIVIFSLSVAALYPFVAPIFAQMDHEEVSTFGTVWIVLIALLVAVSGYAITRRKVSGAFALLAPGLLLLFQGSSLLGTIYSLLVLLVFALPFALAYFDLHTAHAKDHETA